MEVGEEPPEEYKHLKHVRVSFDVPEGGGEDGVRLCFWVYLTSCAELPVAILRQAQSDGQSDGENGAPFLAMSKDRKLSLFPLSCLQKGSTPYTLESPYVSAESGCSLEKWIHVGWQLYRNSLCLYINGALAGQTNLSLSSNDSEKGNLHKVTLAGSDEGTLQGYIYNLQLLPKSVSITDHFTKDPPIQLSLDVSCISDGIEEGSDGVWSIIGGKASCRRNFSLEVVLLDALARPTHKDMQLFASLVYADNREPVEKSKDDTEPPLLINCDGVELPSTDRPLKVVHGRTSFKLKMSQLSSKCDNRLFRVHFQSTDAERYPSIHAYSPSIRCISRNRNNRTPNIPGRKLAPKVQLFDGSHSQMPPEGSQEILDSHSDAELHLSNHNESRPAISPKRFKLEHDTPQLRVVTNGHLPHFQQNENAAQMSSEEKLEDHGGMTDMASDSESTDAKRSTFKRIEDIKSPLTDAAVFRYCLEGTCERFVLLKELGFSASDKDIVNLAEQVSLYAGCSHHRYQIMMTKQLVQEAISLWHVISKDNHAHWIDSIPEIMRKFRQISNSSRGLTGQDIEVLHRISGCGDYMNRESFDKMWSWLFPVAFTISNEQINKMWECTSPKWIEGLITKEEAENSLIGLSGLQEPGMFVLRFPTSRSWPHPDAGSLLVTYVGADHILHNKLLSFLGRNTDSGPLQDLLLEEPELSQLAQVTRLV